MADGFESDRSDAYFNGGMKPRPTPKRIIQRVQHENEKQPPTGDTEKAPAQGR